MKTSPYSCLITTEVINEIITQAGNNRCEISHDTDAGTLIIRDVLCKVCFKAIQKDSRTWIATYIDTFMVTWGEIK